MKAARRRIAALGAMMLALWIGGESMGQVPDPMEVEIASFDRLWDYGDPGGTRARFDVVLRRATEAGDSALSVEILTQIGRTHGLEGEFEAGHTVLDRVQELLRPEMKRAEARYLLERGRVFNSSGKKEAARPLFLEAMEKAQAAGEEHLAIDAVHMLGIVDPPDRSLEWNLKAIGLAEAAADPRARGWLGPLYNNTGWTYHEKAQYDTALAYFEKALAWRQEQKRPEEIRIARWCVARCLRSLSRVEEALKIQQDLQREWEEAGGRDGYVQEELGECLLALGMAEEAGPHFARAHAILSEDGYLVRNEPDRLARLKSLGEGR